MVVFVGHHLQLCNEVSLLLGYPFLDFGAI